MGARMLGQEQQEAFFETGWAVQENVFRPAELMVMRAAFERLRRVAARLRRTGTHRGALFVLDEAPGDVGPAEDVRIHRVVWCGATERVLAKFGRDPRLLRPASQLLGSSEMNQLINQAHFKLPGDGVEFPWHQDSTHRRYGRGEWEDVNGRGSYVQMVLALDDITEENGPIELIPGSCRLGHVEPDPGLEGRLPRELAESSAVAATMRAGSVLMFGPYTFHRSRPNRSGRPRRVLINGFAYPGANSRIYPGEGAGRLLRAS